MFTATEPVPGCRRFRMHSDRRTTIKEWLLFMDESKKLISHPESLPEQGGVFWFAGGVPERSLPKPCVACLDFLASLNEEELQQLIRRARTRTVGMRDEASRDTT